MKFRLEKIERMSGPGASVYTVVLDDDDHSVFEQFIAEYSAEYKEELKYMVNLLTRMGKKWGAREQFFKDKEGAPGDLVSALYDDPDRKLRLYCIRYGGDLIILGGGGPKNVRAWQDDENLSKHSRLMMTVADKVHERFQDGGLRWTLNYNDMSGDFEFDDEEYE